MESVLHRSTAWSLGKTIAINAPHLTVKPQVVFIHHHLITPKMGRAGAGGRRDSACSHLDPENILELPDYSQVYAEIRKGLSTGRKYAKGYPTQLPVTVDEHPGRFAHTILRGDLWAAVCTVEARAWRDRSSGKWHGSLNFMPLRIRVHGQNDMTRQTATPGPAVRLSPRRSAMDAKLDIDLSSTDGQGVTDNNKKYGSRAGD
ncbi:BZ3500_MvSof-1268-A1-R1_Chr5-3g08311 [Microbotryum saponariae]|uniref:BZ3500_MvSof-1268-A1-R1_Chr5-3g08311 protein n=1 Tax=Microbotryum saponariae TaxID=289078 RepID=A0A2X0L083_9BASI|nr:BZ3500_MvSof-1268-A1-R1_Chr5-3g08311 [Microbotryum saponariae]SDA08419.1 BZ3501_MvSof-1269-A2-R1_Chr5-3g08039 [Microbotryum saponariae]